MRQLKGWAVLAAALLFVGGAAADPVAVATPQWSRQPSRAQIDNVFPTNSAAGSGGSATVQCTASTHGVLHDCRVSSETPTGAGFGQAALAVSQYFILRPPMQDGQPQESQVTFTVEWQARTQVTRGDPLLTTVVYAAAPTFNDLMQEYPARARASHTGGRITLACHLNEDGALRLCDIIQEDPLGQGFGVAARAVARHFRVDPTRTPHGPQLRGSVIQLTVVFPPEGLAPGASPIYGRPSWVALPTGREPGGSFPAAALAAHVTQARVVLECQIAAGGRLAGCAVATTTQAGMGFEAAALALSTGFIASQWSVEGLPTVGQTVRVPLQFTAPAAPATASGG